MMDRSMASWFARAFALAVFLSTATVQCSLVTVSEKGGYKQVVVAISPKQGDDPLETLIAKLEDIISKSSVSLHVATREKFYFEEVIFLLPSEFNSSGAKFQVEKREFAQPDVVVLQDEGLPYTVQPSGCGQPGLRILFPMSELASKFGHKAMVQQWAHYRYGVFDEHGYPNDQLYPLVYRTAGTEHPHFVTGCTNEQATYVFQNTTEHECDPFSENCYPHLDDSKNPRIVSSLMDRHNLQIAGHFCDGVTLPHNRASPSMQNALCREKSVWGVLLQNADFKNRATTGPALPTKFQYMMESEPRFVLVVEATDNLALNGRMDLVKNAFTYFALYDIPRTSRISLINLRKLLALYSFLEIGSSVDELLESFPEAHGKADVCIDCGLEAAIRTLDEDDDSSGGSILLVASTDISGSKAEQLAKRLDVGHYKLFVIYFGTRAASRPSLEGLASAAGGKLFFIADDLKPSETISPLTLLYEAFRSMYELISWRNRNIALVAQQVFHHDLEKGTLSFAIEKSVENFQVIITGPEFIIGPPVIKDQLKLKLNGSEYDDGRLTFAYKIKIPAYVVSVRNEQNGLWEATFQRKPNYFKPIVVIVRAANAEFGDLVSARCWVDPAQIEGDVVVKPPVMYAEIMRGYRPVADATVHAALYHYDSGKEKKYRLLDSGEGNPDVREGDGIYTRCLTRVSMRGYYMITVDVHFDESILSERSEELAAPLTRVVTCGSIHVEALAPNFPPRRITDLRVASVQSHPHGVKYYTLQWTAPGDEYDNGQADEYEMKVFKTRNDALNNFDVRSVLEITEWETHGPWLKPKPAGQLQQVIVELRNLSSGSYFFALRTKDADGHYGDVSNLAEVYYTVPSVPITSSPRTTPDADFTETEVNVSAITRPTVGLLKDQDGSNLILIVGTTCGLLLLMIIIAFVLLFYLSRRQRRRKCKKDTISPPYFPRQRPETDESISRAPQDFQMINPVENQAYSSDYACADSLQDRGSFNYYSLPSVSKRVQDNASTSTCSSAYLNGINFSPDPHYNRAATRFLSATPLPEEVIPPFNPTYTSSLRRMNERNIYEYRLGTDV